ncbi:hypothetical protein PAE1962 [Pyrobaculum aerophilum str. IM2]|uniref:Gene product 88 domain-containing protein n=2 Tax=Pyrobaculum aerophilum TaxID=13773 RepID=Q8ZW58_PYRAE|nr:hypothetical protein [Pyrobaculum aerophilum]AAL63844.1 hypothetical protein PAE1962 [Pyrobaculum aerophilum str. IM2]HII46968.1 hypothetical protein [Pyrobaculum aerophilum]
MRLWRVEEAGRLIRSELAKYLAEAWANCGDENCLARTPFDPALVGVGRWWLGPFTIGNRKMGEIPFFSLPPVLTCPGATEFCYKWCYAVYEITNWRAYVREAASYLLSLREDFPQVVGKYLARLPHRVIRLHVSGDFYDEEYFEKWAEIARQHPDRVFYTYTKSFHVVRGEAPQNLIIHLSADPHNYIKAVETWREIKRGLITYVYTPGQEERDLPAIKYILENTDARILVFLNHVQHAPRLKTALWKWLREALGALSQRIVLDPEEFAGRPQCAECALCWRRGVLF